MASRGTGRMTRLASHAARRLLATSVDKKKPVNNMMNFEPLRILKSTSLPGRPVYLDMQATTPLDPRVLDAMLPWMVDSFGNPHSRTHYYGWEAEGAVEVARQEVAGLINADPKEIIFTSGATESNNLTIKGIVGFYSKPSSSGAEAGTSSAQFEANMNYKRKPHVITTQTEHKCVLDSCRHLEEEGLADVTYLPVKPDGLIDIDVLKKEIRPETILVSVMAVNNEIGVIQPMEDIGRMLRDLNSARQNRIFFHTDAAQAVGKIAVDVNLWNVDCMSISGHKIYGPKGVGALYVRRRPRVRLQAQMSGGGQERGLRSGTVPTNLVVGLGAACRIALSEMPRDHVRIKSLSDRLVAGIQTKLSNVTKNGGNTYPGCVNLSFSCVEGESLLMALKRVALSSGSACTSASLEPSYVLRALGTDDDMAHSSIRFGLGRFTTEQEVDYCVEEVVKNVQRLRDLSPLWEMVQQGIDLKTIEWSQH